MQTVSKAWAIPVFGLVALAQEDAENGLSYGRLINGLKAANIALDRKSLAELAVNHPEAFAKVAAQAA